MKLKHTLINESIILLRCYLLERYPLSKLPLSLLQLEENLLDLNRLELGEINKQDYHTVFNIDNEVNETTRMMKEITLQANG